MGITLILENINGFSCYFWVTNTLLEVSAAAMTGIRSVKWTITWKNMIINEKFYLKKKKVSDIELNDWTTILFFVLK